MSDSVYEREMICNIVKPIADKYRIREVYLFGSYARGEATRNSDLDFLVYGGEQFRRTMIFAFAEDLNRLTSKTYYYRTKAAQVELEPHFYLENKSGRIPLGGYDETIHQNLARARRSINR